MKAVLEMARRRFLVIERGSAGLRDAEHGAQVAQEPRRGQS